MPWSLESLPEPFPDDDDDLPFEELPLLPLLEVPFEEFADDPSSPAEPFPLLEPEPEPELEPFPLLELEPEPELESEELSLPSPLLSSP